MPTFDKNKIYSWLPLPTIFLVGVLVGAAVLYYYPNYYPSLTDLPHTLRLSQNEYPLVNPLLLCDVDRVGIRSDNTLQKSIQNFINDRIDQGLATSISVYIVEYGNGSAIGVNENEQYDPASLLKVPLMMGYYSLAESDPLLLSKTTSFTGTDQNEGEYFRSPHDIKAGVSYTIDSLIKSMIINSDNTAAVLLTNYIPQSSLTTVYTDLDLPVPPDNPSVQYISAKSYASFFRVLYNGTYLSRTDSEKALSLLTESQFPQGIRGGVPKGIIVAEKFGERTVYSDTTNSSVLDRELHDCGIIYPSSGSPYLLCIMSRGNDFDNLAANIRDLSSLVYKNVVGR